MVFLIIVLSPSQKCARRPHISLLSVITFYEIISVMYIVSTKMTNTIAANVSINFDDKKVSYKFDCYILHAVLLVITLRLIVTIINYAKHSSKQKYIDALTI